MTTVAFKQHLGSASFLSGPGFSRDTDPDPAFCVTELNLYLIESSSMPGPLFYQAFL